MFPMDGHIRFSARTIKVIVFAVFLIAAIYLIFRGFPKETQTQPPLVHDGYSLVIPEISPIRRKIKVEPAKVEMVSIPFILPATVHPMPSKLVTVYPPVLGRITSINKEVGERVSEGEILFSISSGDMAQALSDMQNARAQFVFASETLERQKKLFSSKVGVQQELQTAQNNYDQALSELKRAESKLNTLKINESNPVNENGYLVRSPINGSVVDVTAGVGSFWNDPNSSIMVIADLSQVFISADAQEKDASKLFLGQEAEMFFDAYNESYLVKVDYISPVLNKETRTIEVTATVDNSAGKFKPNMFVKATFKSLPKPKIVLPVSAIIQRGFDSIVFVESAPWHFLPKIVKTGQQFDNQIEVLAGLDDNDRVVTSGSIILND